MTDKQTETNPIRALCEREMSDEGLAEGMLDGARLEGRQSLAAEILDILNAAQAEGTSSNDDIITQMVRRGWTHTYQVAKYWTYDGQQVCVHHQLERHVWGDMVDESTHEGTKGSEKE